MARVLVNNPAGLDRAWAQSVLALHHPRVRVSGLEVTDLDVGTTTRVQLRVDHDAEELPRRWFVKLPSRSWKAWAITTLPQLPQTEVRFYRELSAKVPIAHPRALAAERRAGRGFLLALADVTEAGAEPGHPSHSLSAARAGNMVELLARLHAAFWESPALGRELAWLAGPVRRLEDGLGSAMAVPLMRRGLALAGDLIAPELHAPALRYAAARRRVMRVLSAGPQTLIHHDCHPGNLYWRGDEPGLLDWQLVRSGEGIGDVAYLLATALRPELRRSEEPELLARYHDTLLACGVAAPPLAVLRERYAIHLTYAFEAMVVTLAVGGLMEAGALSGLIERSAAAVADHGSFDCAAALL